MTRPARPTLAAALLAALALGAGAATADIVTFEQTANGLTPIDDAPIAGNFAIEGGGTVNFFFDVNGNNTFDPGVDVRPRFEQVGADGTDGFVSTTNTPPGSPLVYDRARAGSGLAPVLGQFFARQPDPIGGVPGPFMISYDTTQTIREFSGEIWDIDGNPNEGPSSTERWLVEALDASGNVLDSVLSPLGTKQDTSSLDSLPWNFQFRDLPDGLKSVRLTFMRGKTTGIGLAFNNFSAIRAVPEPSSLLMLGAGGLGLVGVGLRRSRKARG